MSVRRPPARASVCNRKRPAMYKRGPLQGQPRKDKYGKPVMEGVPVTEKFASLILDDYYNCTTVKRMCDFLGGEWAAEKQRARTEGRRAPGSPPFRRAFPSNNQYYKDWMVGLDQLQNHGLMSSREVPSKHGKVHIVYFCAKQRNVMCDTIREHIPEGDTCGAEIDEPLADIQ